MARHPGVAQVAAYLDPNPNLPEGPMSEVAGLCADLRDQVLNALPEDGPELTAGLRKLLEAKDCFVRHALITAKEDK